MRDGEIIGMIAAVETWLDRLEARLRLVESIVSAVTKPAVHGWLGGPKTICGLDIQIDGLRSEEDLNKVTCDECRRG